MEEEFMNLKNISLLTAGFVLAGWVHTLPARADNYCSNLSVSVRPLPVHSTLGSLRDVEVRTNVSPAREVDPKTFRKALISIEVEFEEDDQYHLGMPHKKGFIRHEANWGSFAATNYVEAAGLVKSIRVVNAECVGVAPF
jgi:hypothetical protein